MKKSVFVILFMLVADVVAYAQVDTTKYEYCQMEVIGKLNDKAKISVDFGQYQSIFSKAYRDKITGKVAEFNSPAMPSLSSSAVRHVSPSCLIKVIVRSTASIGGAV